jgi:DNA-directed RNA polymerase subunit H (RpoH/RPB5)
VILAKAKASKRGVILEGKTTPSNKKATDTKKRQLEEEEEQQIQQRVTDHKLVPKHIILSQEEKQQVLTQYNSTEDQFPFLFDTDPVVKEIKAKPGDMVKVIRPSETAGETVYYRYVVEAI